MKMCRYCQSEIGVMAKVCPFCRKRLSGVDPLVPILICIGAVFLAALVVATQTHKTATETTLQEESENVKAKEAEKAEANESAMSVGETITLGNLEITVNKITLQSSISEAYFSFSPKEGGKYLVSNTTIKNIGADPEQFLPIALGKINVKATYKGQYDFSPTHLITSNEDLHMTHLNPLSSKTGIIVFEVADEVAQSLSDILITFSTVLKSFSYKVE